MILAISAALPLTSIATQSSGPRLDANTSNASGVVFTLPADRDTPPSWIATSQKLRWISNPTALTLPPPTRHE